MSKVFLGAVLGVAAGGLLTTMLLPARAPRARAARGAPDLTGTVSRLEKEVAALRAVIARLAQERETSSKPAPDRRGVPSSKPVERAVYTRAHAERATPFKELLRQPTNEEALSRINLKSARSDYALWSYADVLRRFGRPSHTSVGQNGSTTAFTYYWDQGRRYISFTFSGGLVFQVRHSKP